MMQIAPVAMEWKRLNTTLLTCPNYERERDELRKETGMSEMRIESLLGDPKLIQFALE